MSSRTDLEHVQWIVHGLNIGYNGLNIVHEFIRMHHETLAIVAYAMFLRTPSEICLQIASVDQEGVRYSCH